VRALSRRESALLAALLVFATSAAPGSAASGDPRERGAGTHFFVGLGAGACTLLYTPVKLVYATTAIPLSALVYVWSLGDAEMSKRVLLSGTQGDFVVTPEHLRGERRFTFVGSAEEGEGNGEVGGPTPTTASR
jgi:hypothetical protein